MMKPAILVMVPVLARALPAWCESQTLRTPANTRLRQPSSARKQDRQKGPTP
jgi:hypothetical protein